MCHPAEGENTFENWKVIFGVAEEYEHRKTPMRESEVIRRSGAFQDLCSRKAVQAEGDCSKAGIRFKNQSNGWYLEPENMTGGDRQRLQDYHRRYEDLAGSL
ncbi:hypothetical protein SERLA73DRAFT_75839 [Serpula lacrymans var. lacrymans S7.3]|uniref:Uncharacterized protein n=2 Tax=Serpula lacrymans var. lacrymans TaxID=341189 RepID=F8Q4E1_SERL3|nr:uncharacterized protein SERLADRAFT_440604 [Serpula lacrymans var. lacrymans S7.9]EGN96996.1 hypothetical protein SERLA73DRAFT_75839 [Serpula lacrymans var. lacrymans S7.3]EGO22587.1 hypothetical protein SERLADRAFT_440604 [Serpula lacrymans var. lacrymans S7.9]